MRTSISGSPRAMTMAGSRRICRMAPAKCHPQPVGAETRWFPLPKQSTSTACYSSTMTLIVESLFSLLREQASRAFLLIVRMELRSTGSWRSQARHAFRQFWSSEGARAKGQLLHRNMIRHCREFPPFPPVIETAHLMELARRSSARSTQR
jgi:hypothetical protein